MPESQEELLKRLQPRKTRRTVTRGQIAAKYGKEAVGDAPQAESESKPTETDTSS